VQAPFVGVKPRPGVRVLATHILPATVRCKDTDENEQCWVNWEPPPPAKRTECPALIETTHGKGKVVYASFDLYGMVSKDYQWPLEFHYQLLRSYLKKQGLQLRASEMHGGHRWRSFEVQFDPTLPPTDPHCLARGNQFGRCEVAERGRVDG